MTLELALSYGLPRKGIPARRSFETWAAQALHVGQCRGACALSLRIVDADEGRALNRDYRGKDYPTNVLSFPDGSQVDGRRWLGDLALCAPVIVREAAEQGKPPAAHWAHLTVHGVLHLLGHDHEEEIGATAMEALEVRTLTALGYANPYEGARP